MVRHGMSQMASWQLVELAPLVWAGFWLLQDPDYVCVCVCARVCRIFDDGFSRGRLMTVSCFGLGIRKFSLGLDSHHSREK